MTLKILTVGAGIAGLAFREGLKRFLPHARHTLVEETSTPRVQGAGIALPAMAILALKELGLEKQVLAQAHQVTDIIYAKSNGSVLAKRSLLEAPFSVAPFVAMRREALQSILLGSNTDDIQFGKTVTSLRQHSEKTAVTFNDGQTEVFDLVVAADGAHSSIRSMALSPKPLVDLGVTNWRCCVAFDTTGLQPTFMLGQKSVFLAYPIGPNEVYCYFHSVDPEGGLTTMPVTDVLEKHFSQYGRIFPDVKDKIIQAERYVGRLQSVPEVFPHQGCVVGIGDAVTACSPMLQFGGAGAFEGAAILAKLLASHAAPEALKHYDQIMMPRAQWILDNSDGPVVKAIGDNSRWSTLLRNMAIRQKGPLNMLGWRALLAKENPFVSLERLNASIPTHKP